MRIPEICAKYTLPSFRIKPEFSYALHNCTIPKYAVNNPSVNTELSKYPKPSTPATIFMQNFLHLKNVKYKNYNHIYTDGSKSEEGVGSAAVATGLSCTAKLPKEASIYSAEVHALSMAVEELWRKRNQMNIKHHVIFIDSKSVIDSAHNQNDHPTVRSILFTIHRLRQIGIQVDLCWIPSHMGIEGNDRADCKAKQAAKQTSVLQAAIHYRDYYQPVKHCFNNKRREDWRNTPNSNKLKNSKPQLAALPMVGLTRGEEVIMNRLRLGHTNVTHNYMIDGAVLHVPPICHFCNDSILTIEHIFIQCTALTSIRRPFFTSRSLEAILGSRADSQKFFSFLRRIEIYQSI